MSKNKNIRGKKKFFELLKINVVLKVKQILIYMELFISQGLYF
tara:strand:- start:142 stop:270 length:129 start_codon:yes stop_codon:yes gene_type:complete